MSKTLLCLCIALALLSAAYAEGFAFEDAITWNTTAGEAQALLGEGAVLKREKWGEHASAAFVGIENTRCLGLDCARLMLFFFNDCLCSVSGFYTADNLDGDIQRLVDALSARYGAPEYPDNAGMTLSDLINQMAGDDSKTVCTWQPDDVTDIGLTDTSEYVDASGRAYPYMAVFDITNLPVYDDMNDVVDALMDAED